MKPTTWRCRARSLFLIVLALLFSASSDAVRNRNESILFVSDSKEIVKVTLEESLLETRSASIRLDSALHVSKSFEIGTVRFFGYPCIVTARRWDSQLVIIPYYLGGGTGYGVYDWCLVTTEEGKPICKFMGLAHYHSSGRNSHRFDVRPSLSERDEDENVCFAFTLITEMDGRCNVIAGNVSLVITRGKNGCEFSLVPSTDSDARNCAKLLQSNIRDIREWAEKRLESVVPSEMREYKNSDAPQSVISKLENTIKEHYDNKERGLEN